MHLYHTSLHFVAAGGNSFIPARDLSGFAPNLASQAAMKTAPVVDDDYNTCDSVTKMLRRVGMRSEWTLSGKEAVLRARHAIEMEEPFRAYIIDWRLPDMNGFLSKPIDIGELVQKMQPYLLENEAEPVRK